MQFNKIKLDDMERCYCASSLVLDGQLHIILASEAIDGPCYAYSGENFDHKEVVWEKAGGTMSFVQIPGTNGEFLAVQNFFPGFNSAKAKIVWGRHDEKLGWVVKDVLNLPYVHRFDILEASGRKYFIGATLCGSKKDREDWSDPGKLWVCELPDDLNQPFEIRSIQDNLVKNHGFWKGQYKGKEACYTTSDSGILAVTPPQVKDGQWEIEQIMNKPVSDLAVFDIDGDGVDEIITIEPFHGDQFNIYKEDKIIYSYPNQINFAHAIWGGFIRGQRMVLGGIRRENQELFTIMTDKETGGFVSNIIETGGGPANFKLINGEKRDILVLANHSKNEAAAYLITD